LAAATTAVPKAVSEAQGSATQVASEAQSVATKVQGTVSEVAGAVETVLGSSIPRSCTVGTQQFCLGGVECSNLPLDISQVLPSPIIGLAPDKFYILNDGLKIITSAFINSFLFLSLALIIILSVIFAVFISRPRIVSLFGVLYLSWLMIFLALILLSALLIPTVVSYVLFQRSREFPSIIESKQGGVGQYCLGACCCALSILILTIVIAIRTQK
jgi:hypothetical protein